MTPEDERYDYAHFEFVMRGIQAARDEQFPEIADQISLSLHCETAEIMTRLHQAGRGGRHLTGLAAYSASRPPHSEGLAVTIASYLAARDRAADHQPAAPDLAQGDRGGDADGRDASRTSTSAAR